MKQQKDLNVGQQVAQVGNSDEAHLEAGLAIDATVAEVAESGFQKWKWCR